MINVLTYNAPHRKTQDLLFRLKAKGYNDVSIIANLIDHPHDPEESESLDISDTAIPYSW